MRGEEIKGMQFSIQKRPSCQIKQHLVGDAKPWSFTMLIDAEIAPSKALALELPSHKNML